MPSKGPSPRFTALTALGALALLVTGCPTSSSTTAKNRSTEPRVEDEWASIPKTAEWLFATRDFHGSRPDECMEVLSWVQGEEKCKGALCVHARDLTKEWLARCSKIAKKNDVDIEEVEALQKKYSSRSREDPSFCGAEAETIVKEGCGKDKTCQATADSWGTRCGKSDATPLIVRMLERSVERRLSEPRKVTLDIRSCDELQAGLTPAFHCGQQFECEKAIGQLNVYRDRCLQGGARPPLLTAVYALEIGHSAHQPTPPIAALTQPATIDPKQLPTALADGSGAVLEVCDKRVFDLDGYLTERKGCESGSMIVAMTTRDGGDLRVRLGTIDYPGDARFSARVPSLLVAGEAQLREKQAAVALGAELDRVTQLAAQKPAEALLALVKALVPQAPLLRRSPALQKVLGDRDAALVGVFRELGKAKVAASKGKLATPLRVGFLTRAQSRLFADLRDDGQLEIGSSGALSALDTTGLLPQSTAAHLEALKPVLRLASPRLVDGRTAATAQIYATERARTCGAAFKTLVEGEQKILRCAAVPEECEGGKVEAMLKASDEARAQIDQIRTQIDVVITGPGQPKKGEIAEVVSNEGCFDPWW
jgi:hypothetical protein